MSVQLTWLGHNAWELQTGSNRILIDPFLDDSPTAPVKSGDVEADHIFVSHGHFDHINNAANIASRTGATVVANFEICEWLKTQGVAEEKLAAMNTGGWKATPFGRVQLTLAHHSSSLPDGSYGGSAGGFLFEFNDGPRIYFACDTALFLDMKLIGMGKLDLAVIPIGDLFTMGPKDSIEAIKLLNPKHVAPCHYNTWPPIEQDAKAWASAVERETAATPITVAPGESFSV